MQRQRSVRFANWTTVTFVGHAVGMAVFVGLAGLILNISVRRLLLPYATLAYCGLVFSPLLYWAYLVREQPKSCAIRLGVAVFLYLQVLMLALGFSAIRLGILSVTAALNDYAPFMLLFSALASAALYVVARQVLATAKSE